MVWAQRLDTLKKLFALLLTASFIQTFSVILPFLRFNRAENLILEKLLYSEMKHSDRLKLVTWLAASNHGG